MPNVYLSKREQQIMEVAYERGRFTAAELVDALPGKPSNSTVRTLVRILEEKGQLRHEEQEGRYVYSPAHPRQSAARLALGGVLRTFFGGSVSDVVATLLSEEGVQVSDEELDRLQRLIETARKEGK